MKKLSETYKELGIAFTLPIEIRDANGNKTYCESRNDFWRKYEYDTNGNQTYYESSNGYWSKREYDANGNMTYFEDSESINGYWSKREYDSNGNETYYESSSGTKSGTPRSAKTCEGKVVEIDGIRYELKAL